MKFEISIELLNWWHAGSGLAGGSDIDATVVRDASGLPYLPGKTLKGLFRDAATLLMRTGRLESRALDQWFGYENPPGKRVEQADVREGSLGFTSASLPRGFLAGLEEAEASGGASSARRVLSGLFETIASTAIKNGTAKYKSLRKIEAAMPMTLAGEIEWRGILSEKEEERKQLQESIETKLKMCATLIRSLGSHRHRGLGRCKVTVAAPKSQENGSAPGEQSKVISAGTCQNARLLELDLVLRDDVIVNARSATAGTHECLDYLPGSIFLGAAAASLYKRFKKTNSKWPYIAFHSGNVRFGCASPQSSNGTAALPIPASWHYPKGTSIHGPNDMLEADAINNCAVKPWDSRADGQPQQLRTGWFTQTGMAIDLTHGFRMKTAVDDEAFDRSREAALFGYQAIPKGSTFRATIEANRDVPDVLWDELVKFFAAGKTLFAGRSRNAEYGRVRITAARFTTPPGIEQKTVQRLVYHCLSDLALADKNGQPTMRPTPAQFGLFPEWKLDATRTYIRTRSYSPYNAYRNSPGLERQVIVKGSVIVFEALNETVVAQTAAQSIGLYQQDGLGKVAGNPDYLIEAHPAFTPASAPVHPPNTPAGTPSLLESDPVVKVMTDRYAVCQIATLALALGREWAARWQGSGLRKSQWARLRDAAISSQTRTALLVALEGEKGIFTHGLARKHWNAEVRGKNLSDHVKEAINGKASLTFQLEEAGINATEADLDRLALAACREAAIAAAGATKD